MVTVLPAEEESSIHPVTTFKVARETWQSRAHRGQSSIPVTGGDCNLPPAELAEATGILDLEPRTTVVAEKALLLEPKTADEVGARCHATSQAPTTVPLVHISYIWRIVPTATQVARGVTDEDERSDGHRIRTVRIRWTLPGPTRVERRAQGVQCRRRRRRRSFRGEIYGTKSSQNAACSGHGDLLRACRRSRRECRLRWCLPGSGR